MRVCVIYADERDEICISFAREIDNNPKVVKLTSLEDIRRECLECEVVVMRDINTIYGHLPTFVLSLGKKVVLIK